MNADKKISELNPLLILGLEDQFPIVAKGGAETNRATLAALKAAIQGSDFGSELFFSYGIPAPIIGRDIDVYFNLTDNTIYQKISGLWVKKLQFETKRFTIEFTSYEGQVMYQNDLLKGATIKHLFIDGFRDGVRFTTPNAAGEITFSNALNANCKLTLMYI